MALPSRHIIYNELYQKESKEYKEYLLLLGYADDTCQSKYLYLKEFLIGWKKSGFISYITLQP